MVLVVSLVCRKNVRSRKTTKSRRKNAKQLKKSLWFHVKPTMVK